VGHLVSFKGEDRRLEESEDRDDQDPRGSNDKEGKDRDRDVEDGGKDDSEDSDSIWDYKKKMNRGQF
jgi:hypothetical protein